MSSQSKIKIIFPEEDTDLYVAYFKPKGFLPNVKVELSNGTRYPVYFFDLFTINQDMPKSGSKYIAEPGLIIIPEITKEYMENAVEKLYEQGYFEHLKPIEK